MRVGTDIVAIISERTALKRAGTRWSGLCPFHTERSPSFSVNAADGIYYCFGCHAKGDAITFVRETQHLDVIEAVEALTKRPGETRLQAAARAAAHPIARAVKLADNAENMDLSRISAPTQKDHDRLREYQQVRALLEAGTP